MTSEVGLSITLQVNTWLLHSRCHRWAHAIYGQLPLRLAVAAKAIVMRVCGLLARGRVLWCVIVANFCPLVLELYLLWLLAVTACIQSLECFTWSRTHRHGLIRRLFGNLLHLLLAIKPTHSCLRLPWSANRSRLFELGAATFNQTLGGGWASLGGPRPQRRRCKVRFCTHANVANLVLFVTKGTTLHVCIRLGFSLVAQPAGFFASLTGHHRGCAIRVCDYYGWS